MQLMLLLLLLLTYTPQFPLQLKTLNKLCKPEPAQLNATAQKILQSCDDRWLSASSDTGCRSSPK